MFATYSFASAVFGAVEMTSADLSLRKAAMPFSWNYSGQGTGCRAGAIIG